MLRPELGEAQRAETLRRAGVGEVEEADAAREGVGVDEGPPSSLTAEISATVSAAASSPAGRLSKTGYVASRWNVSAGAGVGQASATVGAAAVPLGAWAGTAASAGSAPRPRVSVVPVATSAARRGRRASAARSGAPRASAR